MLDTSFSYYGVVGDFALTQNLFLIANGLGIGAFYSVLVLSIIMFAQSRPHVPEVITGLLGACLIGLSLLASIRHGGRAEGNG